jgi:hypothetical protein
MPALLLLALPVVLAVLAIPYGADSRDLSRRTEWPFAGRPRTP